MKRNVLSAVLASAFTVVATSATAGVIQASYKNFAAEVFGADVSLVAPTIGYSLALPLTGTAGNPNSFTVMYTLDSGTWDPSNLPGATLISANSGTTAGTAQFIDGSTGVIDSTGTKITYSFLLNSGTVFPAGSTINLGSNNQVGSLNNPATGGFAEATGGDGAIRGVYLTLQQPAQTANYCTPSTRSVGVTIALTNAAGSPFDSNLAGALNQTPILQSNVATSSVVTSSSAFGTGIANELSQINVLNPSLGTVFTNPTDITNSTVTINLGSITFGPNPTLNGGTLYDTGGSLTYTVANANWGAPNPNDGGVSENGLSFQVNGAFVPGRVITVTSDAAGTTVLAGTTATYNAANNQATVNVTAAALAGIAAVGGKRTIYVTYTVPGVGVIPNSSFTLTNGTLFRTTASGELQTPLCGTNLYTLTSNGVKIDVRNYVPNVARTPSGGWYSVIRVINTDESQSASTIIAQALLANGTLGATVDLTRIASVDGKTGTFASREVRYYSSDAIDAAMTGTPMFGQADVGGNARLRITAPISSLRVQNYIYNPTVRNFIEASNAQSDEGPSGVQLNGQNNK